MQDIRYALRTLRKQPLFTLVAVATLALGIGANTAIFSLLYQVLLRPLPFPQADRLVFVWNTYPGINLPEASVSIPDYIDRVTQAPAIKSATLFTTRSLNLDWAGRPEQIRALAVTPSFFPTLQRWPLLGRGFTEDEARPAADRSAVLTFAVWTSHYASDPGIVGGSIRITGQPYRGVGVLPADFERPARDVGLIVPFSFTPEQMSDAGRGNEFSSMIARLQPGATIDQANAQFKMIVARNLERLPQLRSFAKTSGFGGYAVDMREQLVGDARAPLYLLQGGVVLLLLIACVNVANLLLMRATGRQRELAIRGALGAGRIRLVRQMVTEGIVLSTGGAAAGLALGLAGVKALIALSTSQIPGAPQAALHLPVLLFTLALAAATGIVFGIAPALTILRTNTAAFWNRLIERARIIPGVESAGLTTNVPFNGMVGSGSYTIAGRTLAPGEAVPHGRQEIAGGDYFRTMRIPLIDGRVFAITDTVDSQPVCVIDEYLVKKYFSDRSPLGEQIVRGPRFKATIVGVVATINSIDLGQPVTKERIYYPAAQQAPPSMALVLKTALDPATLVPQVRAAVQAIDPEQPIADVRTMDEWISRSLQNRRAPTTLLGVFGVLALTLSGIGIYGVLAFGVAQRAREFGIRHALGAARGSIISLVLSEGLRTTGLGLAVGLLGSLALTRYLRSLLFGVTMHDPVVLGGVCVMLLAVATAACFVPARRATRVDPMVALRQN